MTIAPGTIVAPRESPAEGPFIVTGRAGSYMRTVRPLPPDLGGESVFSVEDIAPIPALSIWQPWAWLIVNGFKDVENRTWRPNRLPPWLLIHASKRFRPGEIVDIFEDIKAADLAQGARVTLNDLKAQLGGIVGIARLTGCVQGSRSPWADRTPDTWHWMLREALPLPFCPCKGQQGLWHLTYDLGLLQGARTMPDLTMCRPSTPCPRQDRCYRFTTTPQEQWQSTASKWLSGNAWAAASTSEVTTWAFIGSPLGGTAGSRRGGTTPARPLRGRSQGPGRRRPHVRPHPPGSCADGAAH